jgi:type VI secretion system Hcp family effector
MRLIHLGAFVLGMGVAVLLTTSRAFTQRHGLESPAPPPQAPGAPPDLRPAPERPPQRLEEALECRLLLEGLPGAGGKGEAAWIPCLSFEHTLGRLYMLTTGAWSDNVESEAVKFRKPIDRTSPLLIQAMLHRTRYRKAGFAFHPVSTEPAVRPAYTVTLEDVMVASIVTQAQQGTAYEDVRLDYARITWTYGDRSVSSKGPGEKPKP